MTKRSIFLKNETYSDVQSALGKARTEEEYKRIIWERAEANGWTKEREKEFRHHCAVVGFILPSPRRETKAVESNIGTRATSKHIAEAAKAEFRHSKIVGDVEE